MESGIVQAVLEYGVLGLGWVFFTLLLRYVLKTRTELDTSIIKALQAQTLALQSLEKWVRSQGHK